MEVSVLAGLPFGDRYEHFMTFSCPVSRMSEVNLENLSDSCRSKKIWPTANFGNI